MTDIIIVDTIKSPTVDQSYDTLSQEILESFTHVSGYNRNSYASQAVLADEIAQRKIWQAGIDQKMAANESSVADVITKITNLDSILGGRDLSQFVTNESLNTALGQVDKTVSDNASAGQTALGNEATTRANADTALQNQINKEVQDRENAIAGIPIPDLSPYAKSADVASSQTALSNSISSEANARSKGDAALMVQITNEVSARKAAIAAIPQPDLSSFAKASDVKTVTDGLESSITGEMSARQSADTDLQNQINREIADRKSAISSIPRPDLSGFAKESDIAPAIASAVNTETQAREAGDKALQDAIAQEVTDRDAAIAKAQPDLSPYAKTADIDSSISTAVTNESQARQAADNTLEAAIAQEVKDRQSAIAKSAPDLTPFAKTSDLQSAQTTLQNVVSAEATNREQADTALSNRIDKEVADRITALDNAKPDLSPYAKTSDVNTALSSYAKSSDLQEAESTINASISAETKAREDGDSSNASAISQEVSDRKDAISSEASARQAAIAQEQQDRSNAISTAINSEADTRQKADTALLDEISKESSDRQAAIAQEQKDRDAAIAKAQPDLSGYAKTSDVTSTLGGYVKSSDLGTLKDGIESDISNEATLRKNADDALQAQITQDRTDSVNGINDVNGVIDQLKQSMGGSLDMSKYAVMADVTNLISGLQSQIDALKSQVAALKKS